MNAFVETSNPARADIKSPLVMGYEVVIGFETHAQLSTQSKIFSRAATAFGAEPNTQACPVDLALPGTLPVMNKGAVERAIQFGLAIGAHVAPKSIFARKNYFYPDLPKGYQISQFEIPVVQGGEIEFFLGEQKMSVRLERAHLEEDAGKSLHEDFVGQTGIDLNRAGTPLLEIVTQPDMRSVPRPWPTPKSCTRSSPGLVFATATCRKAAFAATLMCRCASPVRRWAPGVRSRT